MAYLGRPGATAPLTSADIPDNSITAAKIVADTIEAGDLAPNSVDSSELVDGSVDNSHLADDAVGTDELANDVIINTSGAITTTGAFTSVGIDDNASGAVAITIDANEKVGIGTDGTLSMGGDIPLLQVGGTTNATGQVGIMRSNAGVQGGILTLAHTRDALGTYSTVLSDDDTTGQIRFAGSDGTDAVSFTASIISSVDGTPGANDMPGRLVFATSADGSQDPTERMRINSSGWVGINTTAPEAPLEVELSNAGFVAKFDNAASGTQYKGILIMCGFDGANFTNTALEIYDGDGDSQGTITFTGGTVSYNAFTAGHDVKLPDEDNENGYPYGTLVENTGIFYKKREKGDGTDFERGILYNAQKTSTAYSKSVLGAYSGKFSDQPNMHQVYVLGDGHILCNGEKGNISIGDGICTSSVDGEGMKADKMAMIIGIAQEDVTFSGNESKLVAVQYGLRQFTSWPE